VSLPVDPLPEPDPLEGGGLGGLAAVLGAGALTPSLTVTGLALAAAVVSVGLGAGWLRSLEAVAFVREGGVAEFGFDVLARVGL